MLSLQYEWGLMSRENLSLSEIYIKQNFAHEDQDLIQVREKLIADRKFGINVGATEGKFLQFLVGLTNAKTIVEVGVLYGYSTLWMAKALPSDGLIYAIEKDETNFRVAKSLFASSSVAQKIELIHGDAGEVLSKLNVEPDMVFIDADKVNYKNYLNWAMKSVRVGGLIVGDNTFLFGHMIGEDRGEKASPAAIESMTYFNTTLAESPRFRSIMVPTYEGMTLAQRLS